MFNNEIKNIFNNIELRKNIINLFIKYNIFYRIIWYCISILLIIIFFKQINDVYNSKKESNIEVSFSNFINGNYQEFIENKLHSMPFTIELMNQNKKYEYLFFKKLNLNNFYSGNDDYIFGEYLTKAYFGDDYYGDIIIKDQVQKAKLVQKKLKEYNIELLFLLAPGKSSIYTEKLPSYILKTKKKTSNYLTYSKELENQNLNFIDFIKYFKAIKSTIKYPLFSKYGSHWSYYAECIVIDTTIKRLERLMDVNLPNILYNDIKVKDTSLYRDGDVLMKMHMEIPKGNLLAYPQNIKYEYGNDVKPQKILGVGDSYFRGFFYLNAMKNAFDNSQQWYYNNSIIPENPKNNEVWELDLKEEILKVKAIVIVCNEANLKNLGNGFIDNVYDLFFDTKKYYLNKKKSDEINKYKKVVRNNKYILDKLTKESKLKAITIDSLITETALKLKIEKSKIKF
jgi:hypothetical protein